MQTDILQSDSQSLSSVIPSLLNLECHLLQHRAATTITSTMLGDMRRRFSSLLQPDDPHFNPIPAAACLLDPALASVLLSPEYAALLHATKLYILSICEPSHDDRESVTHSSFDCTDVPSTATISGGLNRFKFLASKMQSARLPSGAGNQNNTMAQLNHYLTEIAEEDIQNGLEFWNRKPARYSKLCDIAQDLLSAPASQAYVERIFSLCSLLTTGRRNRMNKSLEMRVFLKLNNAY